MEVSIEHSCREHLNCRVIRPLHRVLVAPAWPSLRSAPGHCPVEGGFELRLVLIAVSADEVDDLAIAADRLLVFAARHVNHSQPIAPIVYEIHDGVGVAGQFILTVIADDGEPLSQAAAARSLSNCCTGIRARCIVEAAKFGA
jgi:hypothetical protein